MLALAAVAIAWASAPAAAGPLPQDYDPDKIYNDTDSDYASALNVTANQSQRMLFYLDCPSNTSSGEFDFLYAWLPAGMDLTFRVEVDATLQSTFRGHLISPEYFRLAVQTVPLSGGNETYFNTTTRIGGHYYFVADGQATCLGGAGLLYNVTWSAAPTGSADDLDNSVPAASAVTNLTVVSNSLTETTDQADFIRADITVSGAQIVLLRLQSASGIILTGGFQFEVYNATGLLGVPPSFHQGLSPNSSAIGFIQNGLQVRQNTSLVIRMWSNGLTGAYTFRVLIETYTPSDTNLDFAGARALVEKGLDGGYLNYTYERVHFHKIFVGNARTLHVVAWSDTINIGLRLFNEQTGTLTHLPRESSRRNPVPTQVPQDIEVMHHYASAANLSGETGWYYVEVTIDDDLVPDGLYAISFYFNDGPVGTGDSQTTLEDTALVGYDVSARFTDLDCQLDAADEDCVLTLRMVASNGTNVNWDFSGSPLLTVTPAANWSGQACADFEARDFYNESATATVCVTVQPVNDAPELTGVAPASEIVSEDGSIVRLVSSWFMDVDGDALTITVSGASNFTVVLSVIAPFVEAEISPAANWNGCENITYRASDGDGLSVSHTVDTCTQPQNDPPTARGSLPEVVVLEDAITTMDLASVLILGVTGPAFEDIDGDTLSYRTYDLVDVQVDVGGSLLTITPHANFVGLASFSVAAYDGIVESFRVQVRVRVNPVNDAPTIDATTPSTSPVVMFEGESKSFTVTASDIDGDALSYTWYLDGTGQPLEEESQYTLEVQVTEELARSVVVRVVVSDGNGGTDEHSWTVDIDNTNLAPTVSITNPATAAEFGTEEDITFSSTANDPDGDTLTYSWTSDRVGAPIGDEQTFTTRLPAGTHRIRLVVSDGTTTNEAIITIVVTAPPPPPDGFLPGLETAVAIGALAAAAVALAVVRLRKRP